MGNVNGSIHNLPLSGGAARPQSESNPQASDDGAALASAQKLNELLTGGEGGRALQVFQIVVPGSISSFLVRLPYVYDQLTFWFPTAPTAPIRFGPQAPTIPVATAAVLILPGTALEFQFDNPNVGAYTLTVFGVRGLPAVVVQL